MSAELVPVRQPPAPSAAFWSRVGRGFAVGGRAIGGAAVRVGKGMSSAYLSVDPDLRRHVAQLPLMALTLLSSRKQRVHPIADDGKRPIVFIHGLMGHPGNFLPLKKFLAIEGYKRTYAISFDGASSMRGCAEQLARFIDEVIQVNGLPPDATVDCIAHSMGGLVTRLALQDPTVRSRVANLVTMGTPHLGTYAARFGATENVRDLRPGSTVMETLRAQLPWRGPPDLPRLVALWSPADVLLLPAEAARAPGADAVEMAGFTHYSYLLSPSAWVRILSILEKEPSRVRQA